MNTENSKTIEQRKFVLNLSHRLGFKSSNKYVALQNIFLLQMEKALGNSTENVNSKRKLQRGVFSLNYLTVLIHCRI